MRKSMAEIGSVLRVGFGRRPWWANLLMLFCFYMAVIYVPWDVLMKPAAQDEDVWFGYVFRGQAAKISGVVHWLVYAAGSWGFWRMSPWMHPWAAVYVAQIAIAMFIFGAIDPRSPGSWSAPIAATPFALLSWWIAQNRHLFRRDPEPAPAE